MRSGRSEFEARFERLAKWCLNRAPLAAETTHAKRFHSAQLERYEARGAGAERAAWRELGRAMLGLDEFITRE